MQTFNHLSNLRLRRRKAAFIIVAWVMSLFTSAASAASDGFFDPGWGAAGREQVALTLGSDYGTSLLIQADGKLLLAGYCAPPGSADVFCATRLHPDGTYDSGNFGPGARLGYTTFAEVIGEDEFLANGALTADGGSVFVGYRQSDSTFVGMIAKLTSAGELDQAASSGTGWRDFYFSPIGPSSNVYAIAVQADGKFVVVGDALRDDTGNHDFGVARFLPNLSLDPGFGNGGRKLIAFDLDGASTVEYANFDVAEAIAIQPDGKIVVSGYAYAAIANKSYATIIRLDASGGLDSTFGTGGKAKFDWGPRADASAVKIDRDGSILIAGSAAQGSDNDNTDFVVNRLLADGSQDPAFGIPCFPFCVAAPLYVAFDVGGNKADVVRSIAVQSDRKILLVGNAKFTASGSRFALARVTRDGYPDYSFGTAGISVGTHAPSPGLDDSGAAIAIGNGGIMVAGYSVHSPYPQKLFGISKLQLDLIFSDRFEP